MRTSRYSSSLDNTHEEGPLVDISLEEESSLGCISLSREGMMEETTQIGENHIEKMLEH